MVARRAGQPRPFRGGRARGSLTGIVVEVAFIGALMLVGLAVAFVVQALI